MHGLIKFMVVLYLLCRDWQDGNKAYFAVSCQSYQNLIT